MAGLVPKWVLFRAQIAKIGRPHTIHRQTDLEQTLLRISGAIQVLQELIALQEEEEDSSKTGQ